MDESILTSRLENVRRTAAGWSARCPAHKDKSNSLSIAASDAGRLLVHCFAGCKIYDVVAAVGLEISDLFEVRLTPKSPEERTKATAAALESERRSAAIVLVSESHIVLNSVLALARDGTLGGPNLQRLAQAYQRIEKASRAFGPAR